MCHVPLLENPLSGLWEMKSGFVNGSPDWSRL
jgi:hypothetical protein